MQTQEKPTNFDVSAYRILLAVAWNSNPEETEKKYLDQLTRYLPSRLITTKITGHQGVRRHLIGGDNELYLGANCSLADFLEAEEYEGIVEKDKGDVYRLTESGEIEFSNLYDKIIAKKRSLLPPLDQW